jgi:hypothetical protein
MTESLCQVICQICGIGSTMPLLNRLRVLFIVQVYICRKLAIMISSSLLDASPVSTP